MSHRALPLCSKQVTSSQSPTDPAQQGYCAHMVEGKRRPAGGQDAPRREVTQATQEVTRREPLVLIIRSLQAEESVRQFHRAQQRLVAGVGPQAAEIRIDLQPRDPGLSLHVGTLSPLERLFLL